MCVYVIILKYMVRHLKCLPLKVAVPPQQGQNPLASDFPQNDVSRRIFCPKPWWRFFLYIVNVYFSKKCVCIRRGLHKDWWMLALFSFSAHRVDHRVQNCTDRHVHNDFSQNQCWVFCVLFNFKTLLSESFSFVCLYLMYRNVCIFEFSPLWLPLFSHKTKIRIFRLCNY